MPNRLVDAVSPYLLSHADNPVDWWEWGPEPFAEAARRDVPVLVSIGYSTCHWCHVMARESFSDPDLAADLNERFVAIKVDREEYPDVDASYLAAAGAFTENLGWPLNVFVTPRGRTFFAGTYFPPEPVQGHPSFRTVLDAVADAWEHRRAEVESNADAVTAAIRSSGDGAPSELPSPDRLGLIVRELAAYEDPEHGGFGTAPKFPMAPVLGFLLDQSDGGDTDAAALVHRILNAMAASPLRDDIEGGFFRYATRRDWSDPHYERMLYDNAQLLAAYARVDGGELVAAGVASFLRDVLRLPSGGFASAQDSESTVDGDRMEGAYYHLDASARARQTPPALDQKVLTGWNGLAVKALAEAGSRRGRTDWIELARAAADHLLAVHRRADGTLVRASIGDRLSTAPATVEDYGMLAGGLLAVALACGEVSYATAARELVDITLLPTTDADGLLPFRVPGGPDAVLQGHGIALEVDPSEGAYPSGISAMADAARTLHLLTGDRRYLDAATAAMRTVAHQALERPISFGASLALMTRLAQPVRQLVVVGARDGILAEAARSNGLGGAVAAVVTVQQGAGFAAAGFELFEGRVTRDGADTAYLCRDFVCRLPVTDASELDRLLRMAG